MIKVLHFFPKDNRTVAQYVETLCNAMGSYADVHASCELKDFINKLRDKRPDIVHLHGCWRMANWVAVRKAAFHGARIVLSPHGGLEPWVVRQHYWSRKLPQLTLYQRRIVRRAAAVIVMGRMEKGCLERLDYTHKIETVLNSLVTCALTDGQMAAATLAVYRKVLDSNVWPLMAEETKVATRALIKAGITGDARWLDNDEAASVHSLAADERRKVALYAYQEGVLDTVTRGFTVTECPLPETDPATVPHYPNSSGTSDSLVAQDGGDINARIVAALRSARKLYRTGKLSVRHVVELDLLLRSGETAEDTVAETLREKRLLPFAGRMMAAMNRLTGLAEGLMPVAMRDGRRAENIIKRITQKP